MNHLKIKVADRLSGNCGNCTDDAEAILEALNEEEVSRIIPVFVYLGIIAVTGWIGNGLVCYVYHSKYNLSSSRWFIFFLAAVDLIICTVNIPLEIVTTSFQYNFSSDLLCKMSVFANLWSLLSLGFTLFFVSIDRFRKVCRPHGWQINFNKSRLLSVGAVLLGFLISLPVLEVYGIYSFTMNPFNVTAHECSFRKSVANSNLAFGYVMFGMLVFTSVLVCICVLYVFIGKRIKLHTQKGNRFSLTASMARKNYVGPALSSLSNNHVNINNRIARPVRNVQFSEPQPKVVVIAEPKLYEETTKSDSFSNDMEESTNLSDDDTADFEMPVAPIRSRKIEKTKSRKIRRSRVRKATFSMFLISSAFVLSYLPFLCLLLARSLDSGFDESLTDSGRAAYKFFLRSYFLNCAINPFMYGISDTKFRQSVKDVVFSLWHRIRSFSMSFSPQRSK